jgi:hypothetical protein
MGIAQEVQRLAAANIAKDKARLELERAQDALRLAKEAQEAAEQALRQEVTRMVAAAEGK